MIIVKTTMFKMVHKLISFTVIKTFFSTINSPKPKICIVGAGPAGFYTAQHLLKKLMKPEIDIYEQLPVPFGLVRFGVAPDHPEVKNVINTFTKTAENPQVRFIGNVKLGQDITLQQLKDAYHIVLLTYGAEQSRNLNIPGERKPNVIPARKIVGWYNGIPWDKDLHIDLNSETVAIFGQGNVAIDVARILLTPVDQLRKTDITEHALESLAKSRVKRVKLIGRRGPLQAAFTIKELREMLKLQNCSTRWCKEDFSNVIEHIPTLARPKKRITELMVKSLTENQNGNARKLFEPTFKRSPLEIIGQNQVEQVLLGVNNLEGSDILNQTASPTNQTEIIDCGLVVTSIGYKSIQADSDIPFDIARGLVKNTNNKIEKGLYVSGWLATGPVGVILTTMNNAFGTAEIILNDIETDNLLNEAKPGFEAIGKLLHSKNVQIIDWKGWKKIDSYEQKEGEKVGKPREKVVDIDTMLKLCQ